jgi:type II secretory pathway pseudopilin PulG
MSAPRTGEAGYTLVALMAGITIMMIMMAAAMPSWRYVIKNDRELELIAHGGEIADAIQRYQQRNGNALPPSLEVLVKGKFLRHEYKDPMTKGGKWRFIRQGESINPIRPPGTPGTSSSRTSIRPTPTPTPARQSAFSQPAGTLGGIQGVASTSKDESLRVFNGRTKYNEWLFLPGQPRDVGRPSRPRGVPGAPRVPGSSSGAPTTPGGARTIPGGLPPPPFAPR